MTEAEANRGIVHLTEAEAEAEEKSPFLGKTEAEAEDSVDPCFKQTANTLLFSGQLEDDIDQFKNMLGKLHNDLSE